MNKKNKIYQMLCIVCPEGCEIKAVGNGADLTFNKGVCKRGEKYAKQEIINPCRYLTSTVKLIGGNQAMLPVRSSREIPKSKLIAAANQIASLEIAAPVKLGDILLENIVDTGIPLIATKSCYKTS